MAAPGEKPMALDILLLVRSERLVLGLSKRCEPQHLPLTLKLGPEVGRLKVPLYLVKPHVETSLECLPAISLVGPR
jgi:hypothetical protein